MATIAHSRNYIAHLQLDDGTMVSDHNIKAGLLWTAFKERLGVSEGQSFLFDIAAFVLLVDLPDLDLPFTKMEIDQAIKDMPSDHAPGPDSFNGHFMKNDGILFQRIFIGFVSSFGRELWILLVLMDLSLLSYLK